MRLVRAGQTLAVFQIESPGQWHLLAQTQPETFDDLIIETALFRPGPLQGGFIRPYVERRRAQAQQAHEPEQEGQRQREQGQQGQWRHQRQRDAVQTPWHGPPADDFWTAHPVLGPILRDTEGILLFQEQVLEIAHQYAGLSLGEADGFRRAMSHARDPEEMVAMHDRFLAGALARDEAVGDAERVFAAVSAYTGYGFCRSHAAEFARTIYQTAYLKAHFPAHYLAGFLSAQPAGYFPPHVVLEEAKLLSIPVLGPDINRSEDRFTVERVGSAGHERWAIRIGLRQIAGVGDELAEAILWERRWHGHGQGGTVRGSWHAAESRPSDEPEHPFTSLADVCHRLRGAGLTLPTAEALVLAGACDGLRPAMDRRRRLWHLHELWPLVGAVPAHARGRGRKRGLRWGRGKGWDAEQAEQMVIEWEIPPDPPSDLPALPAFDREERTALDYQFLGLSPRPHPMTLLRRDLRRRGVRAIADLAGIPQGRMVRVAGWAISAQRPPTANGMGFVVLEDETGRLPVALPPRLAEQMHRVIRDARVVAVAGRVERVHWYCSLLGYRWEAVA
jgi:error-prone DNA polymerase